jgi:hypothetical protein
MARALLIITSSDFASRAEIQSALDEDASILHWYSCLPSTVICTTESTAGDLAKRLEQRFGAGAGKRFLVMEITGDRQGRLPRKAWHLMRHPEIPQMDVTTNGSMNAQTQQG